MSGGGGGGFDVDAEEEDQLAEDGNENAPTHAPISIVGAPLVPAPIFKPAPAPVTQPKSQSITNSWSIPTPKDTQPVPPVSPKSTARNAPADSLHDYSKALSGTSLCYDVVMGEPEARTIARTAPQDELPTFVIGLNPMFDPTPWIERRNRGPRVRTAPASTQAVRQTGTICSWATTGLELTSSGAGVLQSKDTAAKYSVRDAPERDTPIASTLTTPASAPKSESVPPAVPAPVKPVPFDWAAAGLKPNTPAAGEWTCTVCSCVKLPSLTLQHLLRPQLDLQYRLQCLHSFPPQLHSKPLLLLSTGPLLGSNSPRSRRGLGIAQCAPLITSPKPTIASPVMR